MIVMAMISLLGGLLPIVVIATLVFLYRKPIKVTLMLVMMNLTMMIDGDKSDDDGDVVG